MTDYYKILGVGQKASKQDIKKAYKKLAKQYHPDVNKSPDATAKFKKISEAYETLGDDVKKRNYDHGGAAHGFSPFSGFENMSDIFSQFFTPRGQNKRRPIITIVQHFTIEEMYVGCDKKINVPLTKNCTICAGQGIDAQSAVKCHYCKGSGNITTQRGFMSFTQTCPSCLGRGMRAHPCAGCGGNGCVQHNITVDVNFPKHLNTSQSIRLNDVNGHVVHINPEIINNTTFLRKDYNLLTTKTLTYVDALLGCKYIQKLPDGTSVKVTVSECTQHNTKVRLANKGFYTDETERGDLIITFKINLPSKLKDDEKQILQKLKTNICNSVI
tara:strand:- start:31 stop:1014 length:984 start_codon:yes stop_codon:yes gene_type:complete